MSPIINCQDKVKFEKIIYSDHCQQVQFTLTVPRPLIWDILHHDMKQQFLT